MSVAGVGVAAALRTAGGARPGCRSAAPPGRIADQHTDPLADQDPRLESALEQPADVAEPALPAPLERVAPSAPVPRDGPADVPRRATARVAARAAVAGILGVGVVAALTSVALAFWTSSGSGAGTGSAGTIATPSITGATSGAGTVALSWSAVPPLGAGTMMYFVTRGSAPAGGTCPTASSPAAALSCTDAGLTAGTYDYTVTAVWHTWSATTSPATEVVVASGPLSRLSLSAAASTTAGATDNLTIRAVDAQGLTVASYAGSHTLTFAGASSIGAYNPTVSDSSGTQVAFGSPTALAFTAGVATVAVSNNGVMRLYRAETASVTVAESGNYTSNALSVTVSGAAIAAFAIPTPSAQVAGTPVTVSITAKDAYGNTASYAGAECLTFSGPAASPGGSAPSYPARGACAAGQSSVTFTAGVAASVSVTLVNAASTVLTATDAGSGKTGSTGAFSVSAASVSRLLLAAASTTPTAGAADNLTITAIDAYGNTATSYAGSHALTYAGATSIGGNNPTVSNSSGAAIAFGSATATSFTAGIATVSGAGNGVMRLYRAETVSLTVAESGNYASAAVSVTVSGASIASFVVATPSSQVAGAPFTVSMTAKDAYGNTANYAGTQCVVFSGPASSPGGIAPSYPAAGGCSAGRSAVTFTSGSASPTVTLTNAASTTITVTDAPTGSTGSTGSFAVTGGSMSRLWLNAASKTPTIATADNLTVTAGDAYGNVSTGYTGSHTLTFAGANSSGGYNPTVANASGSAIAFGSATTLTFSSGVATVSGANNGVMRLYQVETASITVSENGSYTSAALSVTPALPAGLGLKVQYRNHAGDTPTDDFAQPDLQVVNTGSISVDLSLVTVRYWFTRDGGSTTFWSSCWWYNLGCGNLSSSVTLLGTPRTGADSYAEVAFAAGAGTLTAGGNDGGMMVAWNKSDWSVFDDTNDYSYLANTPSFVDSTKVTAYYYGNLAWGSEP